MIRIENITKKYNSLIAVDRFSAEIPQGSTTVLIGQSGCGKSTIIRILTGLTKADSGDSYINDLKINDQNIGRIRKELGYVIQSGGLFPHLSVQENILMMAKYFKWTKNKISSRLDELINLTNFPPEGLNKYPSQISGGQQQRVSLMRALMLNPKILLLDEPLGALDPLIRYDLQEDLKAIFAKLKKTVLIVTHDLSEAAFFADQIILMQDGRIVQSGTAGELFKNPKNDFVKKFINAQRVNYNSENIS
ncbi:MAG: ATP-binding cassette domain-containing protein [Ignavibacteriae bacterium]|nr:ATP-binding cassette domain-containing protein [Ignavibacteriota bacterium]NOG96741.1 ATP-binding cassette domain-containing protein [Ignavibacteriota bacterium]